MKMMRRWLKRCAWGSGFLAVALWIAWLLLPKPELLPQGAEFSRVVLDRDGRVLFVTLTQRREISAAREARPNFPRRCSRRRSRWRTGGSFPTTARICARSSARLWGVVSRQRLGGGSTLTMQYARLRWHLDTRSVWGKLTQVFRAVQLERHYGKTELAEAYFTFAPYGGNVEGVPAASLLWCGKPARDLSLREAAALSVLPQSPTARRPRAGRNPALATAQGRLMARLRAARGEPASELDCRVFTAPRAGAASCAALRAADSERASGSRDRADPPRPHTAGDDGTQHRGLSLPGAKQGTA